jgi:hypothetical protein
VSLLHGFDDDDATIGGDVVRGFMLTRGRTRASVPELAIETVVTATAMVRTSPGGLQLDHRRIVEVLSGPLSIAEISAHLRIPLRASIVLVSEMVAAGTLIAGESIDDADTDLLEKIRSALQLL